MDRFDRIATVTIVIIMGTIAVPNLNEARQRSLQKRTMATMYDAATRHEAGQHFPLLRDGWDHPMQVRVNGKHYSIRAAGRDGKFESSTAPLQVRLTTTYEEDFLLIDGKFRQMPEGI